MYLINWVTANTLMGLTVLLLFLIPIVIGIVAFTKKKEGDNPSTE